MNLIVGGTGFIGGHVVEYLFKQGEISKGTFRKGSHLKIMDACGVQGIEADLLDHHSLHEAMEGVDTVYSMASPMPGVDSDFVKVNTEGVQNLLEVALEGGVKTLVHLSTVDVCGFGAGTVNAATPAKPAGEYQTGKAEAERALLEFSRRNALPRVVIIRSARAIGSRDDSLTTPLLRVLKEGRAVLPGSSPMSFAHPQDIAQAMYKAATGNVPSGFITVVKSFDTRPRELAGGLLTSLGITADVRGEGLFSKSSLPPYASAQLRASLTVGPQPNWADLGYSPTVDMTAACGEISTWCKKEPWATDAA